MQDHRLPRTSPHTIHFGKACGIFLTILFCLLCTHACASVCVCEDQRTTCRSQLFPPTLWVPRIRLKSSCLAWNTFTHWVILLALRRIFFKLLLFFFLSATLGTKPQKPYTHWARYLSLSCDRYQLFLILFGRQGLAELPRLPPNLPHSPNRPRTCGLSASHYWTKIIGPPDTALADFF